VRTACVSIGEVAEREGLSPEALRFYERLGLVFPAGRTKSGYRLYDVETLRRLRFIRMARELGSSVEEIREPLRSRRQRYAAGCNSAWGKSSLQCAGNERSSTAWEPRTCFDVNLCMFYSLLSPMKRTLATLAVVALLSGCTGSNAPSAPDNRAPVIDSLVVAPPLLRVGESATVTCYARDPDGDPLQYRWSASAGDLLPMGDGSRVRYIAAPCCGGLTNTITVIVQDGRGGVAYDTAHVVVSP
jgi:DNA-binding transcriptional MerR regulator